MGDPAGFWPRIALAAAVALAAGHAALADQPAVATVTVVATTPLTGATIDIGKVPYEVSTLTGADLDLAGPPSATRAMSDRLGDTNVNDNLDDPFQPDVLYRGFTASPVLGTPEGLAVYQSGVRINEPFDDAINWDLIPDDATARIDVVGANPVYGLNALGGAVVVSMKNGFDDPGGEATLSGGSFGERAIDASYGSHSQRFGLFISARALDTDGWRQFSPDNVRQLYADLAWRGDRLRLDLSYAGGDNALHGESPSPVQELAVGRQLIFTSPQLNADRLNFIALNGGFAAAPSLSFQNLYVRDFSQRIANGNTTSYRACIDPASTRLLCQPDGVTPLTGSTGGSIPDLSQGGTLPIGEDDLETLQTFSFGGAGQGTWTARFLGWGNQLAVGVDAEGASVHFDSAAEPGVINPSPVVLPSPYIVSTPESTPFTATPVALSADDAYAGAFATDTFDATSRLSLTASGRFNWITIALHDQRGASLIGTNDYARFNPAAGATYRVAEWLTAYAGFAEGSRAPTAGEIECSSPTAPCLLPSSLSADPHGLKQVVSQTWEAGVRGALPLARGSLTWRLGLYRAQVRDDIYGVATSISAGYFQNIVGTLRQGGELALTYRDARVLAYMSYAYVDAVFDTTLLLPSPANPFHGAAGDILVRPGDELPGIPRHRLKVGTDLTVFKGLRIGGDAQVLSSQFYRGDEANLLAPLPGYAVVGLHANYAVNRRIAFFLRVENLLNARYADFGVLGDPTGAGAPGVPTGGLGVNPRFQSPGAPTAVDGGIQLAF
jgi:iron complex outermembrane receptor protein